MDQVDAAGIIGSGVITENPRAQDWERRIAERSEQLYRSGLVKRFLLVWACAANPCLIASTVWWFALSGPRPLPVAAAVATLISVVLSARLLYTQHLRVRGMEQEVRAMELAFREQLLDEFGSEDLLGVRKHYRAHLPEVIERYRAEARGHRRRDGAFQGVVIAGSVVAACTTALSVSIVDMRWGAVALSLVVAIAAALAGHGRFRERGAVLQQTADSLEREYESVELRVGRYRRFDDEALAYAEFADTVEALRAEHGVTSPPRIDVLGALGQ
ncbi:hypothetical protein A8924_0782 [Saccharopolyspora erythraea NRRL 2338]|uniref:Uncharacterized protein n=2 Tax=Saccharopolyspora erythraea TaxID=1836 RepID=A4F6R0_SACEN|nr:SLATT domain-containing protein [Saccharopolyspora erythraea]EQD87270.1 hypothetical protein N599_05270 [Saccharopolyspora erythraea D]PFG93537.1 hypothetical protein A8924_0782 [Saccharopolyspora erythraea NRRL 2338]QRK90391.1 SLATT domain-containing protein [Saccharopolyspora erythraea]CAL99734.1 hypothetical protein SACE_0386 [Saccharopolyspora erythraea NRRL 2338]